jgi:hypothetical protein
LSSAIARLAFASKLEPVAAADSAEGSFMAFNTRFISSDRPSHANLWGTARIEFLRSEVRAPPICLRRDLVTTRAQGTLGTWQAGLSIIVEGVVRALNANRSTTSTFRFFTRCTRRYFDR